MKGTRRCAIFLYMKLKLRFFASLRERLGRAGEDFECPEGITVGKLRQQLSERYGQPDALAATLLISVNWEPAGDDEALSEGDEVAFLPPMSGGAGAFWLSEMPINSAMVEEKVRSAARGGVVTFVGTVREESRGKKIRHLEYEAYPGMAEKKMEEIGEEITRRWPGTRVAMAHRTGKLDVGEVAVAVAVAAPHRGEAFEACRHAIDQLKARVPIWKKEFATDGAWWVEPHA
ncbi:MAG: molybdenum cofactor biosynthesis protein MoaE [Myxococcota bacterium]